MLDNNRLNAVAELIRDHITLDGVERYCMETGVQSQDFAPIEPRDFEGDILAVDGSNAAVCGWSVAKLNLIRAGYAVYIGPNWQRTVITYDNIFLADPMIATEQFDPQMLRICPEKIVLKESDLDRLSTYFRELQEYIALADAIWHAHAGDLVLYDGSFDVFEPLRQALYSVFALAEERQVALLAVSKESSLLWGEEISLPFVQHTGMAGSLLAPGRAWYLSLRDKKVDHGQDRWDGETYIVRFSGLAQSAFRVDAPAYLADEIRPALEKIAAYSSSAECLGYPHALFRAHRDIRIGEHEGAATRLKLMELLFDMGVSQPEVRMLMQDRHDILEMRPSI
jgi:hypothetical protein